jgi:dipeptidyl aminopeptidase/acylaminoacyl peptidase
MRRSLVIAITALAAVGGVATAIAALQRGASENLDPKLGFYDAVFVVSRAGTHLRQLTHDRRFHGYAWSPDGRSIAAVTRSVDAHGVEVRGPLELVKPSSSTVRDVPLTAFATNAVWSSDVAIEVLATSTLGKLVDTRLLSIRPSGDASGGASIGRIGAAAWDPHGRALAIVRCGTAPARQSIDVLSASGALRRHLGPLPGALPAGACDDPLAAADEDLTWAPDGRSLFLGLPSGLWSLSLNGAAPRRIEHDVIPVSGIAVSPDGRQIVIEASGARPGHSGDSLYILSAARGHPRLLSADAASGPAWSPDGRIVAFVSGTGDAIETIPRAGGAETTLVRLAGSQISSLSWSPTGEQLAFTAAGKPPQD